MGSQHRLPDASDYKPRDGDLVVGDPHGDLEGIQNLIKNSGINLDKNRVVSVGDNVDRGHDSKGMLDFMDKIGAVSIKGNHEHALHRYAQHEMAKAATGKKNPMTPKPEMLDTIKQLGDDFIPRAMQMGKLPLYLPFEDSQGSGHIVHGGVSPHHSMEDQEQDKMLIRRYHPQPKEFLEEENEEHPFWARSYPNHLGTILHGHSPSVSHDFHGNPNVYSLDGGGVFGSYVPWGGVHRGVRLGDRKIFQEPGSPQAEAHYKSLIDAVKKYRGG